MCVCNWNEVYLIKLNVNIEIIKTNLKICDRINYNKGKLAKEISDKMWNHCKIVITRNILL